MFKLFKKKPEQLPYISYLNLMRSQKDISVEKLASWVDVSPKTIRAIELGKYIPSLDLAFRLAYALEVEVYEIFSPL